MNTEKFDKIGYEFTMASGDIDWSDCNFYGEKNGKKTWIGTLGPEREIYGSDEYWTYEDIEDFARKAVIADEMAEMLDEVASDLTVAFASQPGIEDKIWQDILKEDIENICNLLKKARGEE